MASIFQMGLDIQALQNRLAVSIKIQTSITIVRKQVQG
jgi:hypothetical protein